MCVCVGEGEGVARTFEQQQATTIQKWSCSMDDDDEGGEEDNDEARGTHDGCNILRV